MEIRSWEIENIDKEILSSVYDCKLVHDGGIKIILYTENQSISILYDRFVSYRYAEESYLLNYWDYVIENNIRGAIFFKLIDSSYLNDIRTLSKNFLVDGGGEKIEHHAIFTQDECFEILSDSIPKILIHEGRIE